MLEAGRRLVGTAMRWRFGPDWGGIGLVIVDPAWQGQRQGEFLRIDVTGESALSPWLSEAGLPEVGAVTRMVRGSLPAPAAVRVFALISQTLG